MSRFAIPALLLQILKGHIGASLVWPLGRFHLENEANQGSSDDNAIGLDLHKPIFLTGNEFVLTF